MCTRLKKVLMEQAPANLMYMIIDNKMKGGI